MVERKGAFVENHLFDKKDVFSIGGQEEGGAFGKQLDKKDVFQFGRQERHAF